MPNNAKLKWDTSIPERENGIIVGCDQGMEIMLPWWWNHYCQSNELPVAFFDLGMSKEAARWCAERGILKRLHLPFPLFAKRMITPHIWEKEMRKSGCYHLMQYKRLAWFKKALVFLHTPFQHTIWLDIDCQVNCQLEEMIANSYHPSGLSLAKGNANKKKIKLLVGWDVAKQTHYNSGVIVYRHGSPLIEKWTRAVVESDSLCLGDQDILELTVEAEKEKPLLLPDTYNWRVADMGINPHAHIIHYAGKARTSLLRSCPEAFYHNLMRKQ
jgi:hypothetical protein